MSGARVVEQGTLWLARLLVAEAGWTAERDHEAIRYAVHRRARRLGRTLAEQARSYGAGLGEHDAATTRQRWVRALPSLPDPLVPPPGWPSEKARWDRHAPLWRAVLRFASGKPTRPRFCKLPPEHWGGRDLPRDVANMSRAIRRGHWVDAECEGTRNRFAALVETLPASVAGGAG